MKQIFLSALIIVTFAFTACNDNKTKTDKKNGVTETNIQLQKGNVQVFDYGTVKLHAYHTKDLMNDVVIILEKGSKAVILKFPI